MMLCYESFVNRAGGVGEVQSFFLRRKNDHEN